MIKSLYSDRCPVGLRITDMEPHDHRDLPDYWGCARKRDRESRKIAICLDDEIIEVYDNALEAAREMMISKQTVYTLISSKKKNAEGYTLKYLGDEDA